jgi:hypothetical protein
MRETGEFKIEYFYGSKGSHTEYVDWNGEVWVWQLAGTTTVKLASGLSHTLNASDSLLIPQNDSYKIDVRPQLRSFPLCRQSTDHSFSLRMGAKLW